MKRLAVAVFLLSICCGGESGSNTAPSGSASRESPPAASKPRTEITNPCELLTFEDFHELTLIKYKAGTRLLREGKLDGAEGCAFVERDDDSGGAFVHLFAKGPDAMARYKRIPDMAPLSEIGEEAYWSGSRWELIARRGDRAVLISGVPRRQWAEQLARRALERL